MNLPNKLSLLRIILIPVTMLFMLPISIYGFEPEGWNYFINEYGMMIAGLVFISLRLPISLTDRSPEDAILLRTLESSWIHLLIRCL